MSRIAAVLRTDLHYGFSLAGIQSFPCANHREQMERLAELIEDRDVGMVIIDEDFLDEMEPMRRKDLLKQTRPLLVPIPSRLQWSDSEELTEDDLIHQLIRQAVGYQLNIQF